MPPSGRAPVNNLGRRLFFALFLLTCCIGCASQTKSTTQPLNQSDAVVLNAPAWNTALCAFAVPPIGWKPDPIKQSASHVHEVWLSPDGRTAYGIIYFHLPLPVGRDLALWGFLNQMKQTEGEATLENKQWDGQRKCLRFVAEGGLYKIRTNLSVDGFVGWAVYAGTLRAFPINTSDLATAEIARERTAVGSTNGKNS